MLEVTTPAPRNRWKRRCIEAELRLEAATLEVVTWKRIAAIAGVIATAFCVFALLPR